MLECAEFMKKIPHRYPFLLIDKIIEVGTDSCVAIKNVTLNDYCYEGLAENTAQSGFRYPYSLMIESLSQAAAYICACIIEKQKKLSDYVMIFGSIRNFQFHAPVYPGDTLMHKITVERELSDSVVISGISLVGETKVAEVEREIMAVRPYHELSAEQESV